MSKCGFIKAGCFPKVKGVLAQFLKGLFKSFNIQMREQCDWGVKELQFSGLKYRMKCLGAATPFIIKHCHLDIRKDLICSIKQQEISSS